jgi:predicted ArsR family transcriptional regulator
MPTKSTRQRILDILTFREEATSAELSRALALTKADIRYHLSRMVEEGLIVCSNPKQQGKRGRPARSFSLTSKSFQNNYDLLSSALLTVLIDHFSDANANKMLNLVAEQLSGDFKPGGPPGKRLVQIVNQLNLLKYQARWEAHSTGPRVIFEHCPFATLRPQHPELCRMDAHLVENFLDERVALIESSSHLPGGICLFTIPQKSPKDH